MDTIFAKRLPGNGWLRLLLRSIWLYRLPLGRLQGHRGLVLTHIGRRNRQLRQTLLEVVAHDPATDMYIVAAGWDTRSNWFRDIQKNPHVLVDVRGRRFEAIAARLSETEAKYALRAYACQYPRAFDSLAGAMTKRQLIDLSEDYRTIAHALRLIALRPLHEDQPLEMRDSECRVPDQISLYHLAA